MTMEREKLLVSRLQNPHKPTKGSLCLFENVSEWSIPPTLLLIFSIILLLLMYGVTTGRAFSPSRASITRQDSIASAWGSSSALKCALGLVELCGMLVIVGVVVVGLASYVRDQSNKAFEEEEFVDDEDEELPIVEAPSADIAVPAKNCAEGAKALLQQVPELVENPVVSTPHYFSPQIAMLIVISLLFLFLASVLAAAEFVEDRCVEIPPVTNF